MASPVVSPQSSRAPFGDINAGNQKNLKFGSYLEGIHVN